MTIYIRNRGEKDNEDRERRRDEWLRKEERGMDNRGREREGTKGGRDAGMKMGWEGVCWWWW